MSYQVIARKWRPNTFNELIGQDHVSQTLLNALKNERLPQAVLFTGQRGTGKTSTARILAKSLRCPQAKDFVPCNQCEECEQVGSGQSISVIELDGASHNGVEAIRDLLEDVSYMPSSGYHKVYIIDEVHMLSTSAFNALLKTLEEPPKHVIFILATTEVQKIPLTILSRVQRFDFRRISTRKIADQLTLICEREKIAADPSALWAIARQADGSMRDSQSLLDQVITFCEGTLTYDKAALILGLTDRALLVETLEGLALRDSQKIISVIEKIFQSSFDPKLYIQDLLEQLRNILLVKMSPQQLSQVVDLPDSEIEELKRLGQDLSEEEVHLLFDMGLKGASEVVRAQDPRIVLEMLLLKMVSAPRVESLSQWLNSGKALPQPAPQKQMSSQPVTPKVQSQPQPPASVEVKSSTSSQNLKEGSFEDRWFHLVKVIKAQDAMFGAKLEHLSPQEFSKEMITLGVPQKLQFLLLQTDNDKFKTHLAQYIQQYWEVEVQVKVVMAENSENVSVKAKEEQKQQEENKKIQEQVEVHPVIQAAQSAFNGKITSIKEMR